MIVRQITADDAAEDLKVPSLAYVWPTDLEKEEKPYAERLETEKHIKRLGAFCNDNRTLMARLAVLSFENNFCGTYLKSNGIGGVATRPEFRRAGAVRALFGHVFRDAREDGTVLSTLYPFSFDYYRQFGYERVTQHADFTLPFNAISHIERSSDVKLFEGGGAADILTVYNEYASRYNMMFRRTDDSRFYKSPYTNNEYTYIWYDKSGRPASYASYTVDGREDTVCVREVIYRDAEALRGIIGFLRCYDGNYENLRFTKLPLGSPVMDMATEYTKIKISLTNGAAARILDLRAALEANVYPEEYGRFALRSPDDCVNGDCIFDVEYQNKKTSVSVRREGDYDISLSAAAAARLILSGEGLTEDALQYIAGVRIKTSAADFLRAFPKRPVDLYEGF